MKILIQATAELQNIVINAELIDLRSIRPLDEKTVYESLKKTNRVVIIDESWPFVSVASYLGWLISKNCFDYLDVPKEIVTSEDTPMPYNHRLEIFAQPSVEKIIDAVKKVMYL